MSRLDRWRAVAIGIGIALVGLPLFAFLLLTAAMEWHGIADRECGPPESCQVQIESGDR